MVRHASRWLAAASIALVLTAAPVSAIEVRTPQTETRYLATLTRAYEPCLAPNDVTNGGLPACSPAVSSKCAFDVGRVQVRTIPGLTRTLLDGKVQKVSGPGDCTTDVYTLDLGVRITGDDPACAGGRCTFGDVTVSRSAIPDEQRNVVFSEADLEELLPTELVGLHYEILAATVTAPDGRPFAAAGIGDENAATTIFAAMGAGYEACDAPNTSGTFGPACGPPTWPSTCDTNGGFVNWRQVPNTSRPAVEPSFVRLTGPSATCANGTYVVRSALRMTTLCVGGGLCTAVDSTAAIPVAARHGKIVPDLYPVDVLPGFDAIVSMELREMQVHDPTGATFATAAISPALRLDQPSVTLALKDVLDPNDDTVRIDARLFVASFNGLIDPTDDHGVTFTITDRNGPIYQVTIPGALWQLGDPIGSRWDFADPIGGIGGVRKASIKLIDAVNGEATYKIQLAAKNVNLSAADLPGVDLLISIPSADGFTTLRAQRNRTCKVNSRTFSCK
jgi:hypothetical protein